MSKKRIAVFGTGNMGTGIAQAFATKGFEVMMIYFYDDKTRTKPLETMRGNLQILCDHGVMDPSEIEAILGRVKFTEDPKEAADFADIFFECVVENLEVKQDVFKMLDEICPPNTILCSNTSALAITLIGEKSVHRDRIIGTHFWNPAYLIPLVEVVKTEYVDDKKAKELYDCLSEAGKHPVMVEKDVPGFLANRLQHCLFREAISIVENGIATPKAVDEAIKYGFGMRLGIMAPFEVMDSAGLDMTKAIHEFVFPDIEDTHEAQKLVTDNVAAGRLGFKTGGHGIIDWTEEEMKESREQLNAKLIEVAKALGRI